MRRAVDIEVVRGPLTSALGRIGRVPREPVIDLQGFDPVKPRVALAGLHFDRAPWEPKGITVCRALMEYASEHIVANGGRNVEDRLRRFGYTVRRLLGHFDPQMPIESFERKHGREYAAWRQAAGVSGSCAARELTFLIAALNHQRREERIKREFIIWTPRGSKSRVEVVTPEQEDALMASDMSRRMRLLFSVGFNTGARAEAIEEVPWRRCDLERRIIAFGEPGQDYKNKRRAIVPINDRLLAVLREARIWRDLHEPNVEEVIGLGVTGARSTTYHQAVDCWAAIGLKWDAPRHVMRHTFATRLLQARVPVERVAALMGDDVKMVLSTYNHWIPSDFATDIEKLH